MNFDSKISRRRLAKSGAAVATATVAVGTLRSGLYSQEATPIEGEAPGLPPLPEGASVVAAGLWNPRNLVFAEDGTLYITENGIGGDEVLSGTVPPDAEATPIADEVVEATPVEEAGPPSTRGYTGQISMVAPDGTQSVVVDGLASYSDGAGPVGIVLLDGDVIFTIGGAAVGMGIDPLPEENTVNRLNLETGEVELIAELGSYEVENNPDGTDINPNIYDLVVTDEGGLYVSDAGANVIYNVDPANGEFEPVAILPLQGGLPEPSADPAAAERQLVPTGLGVGDGGTVYAAFLGEFWPADAPSIVTVDPDGNLGTVATGLQAIVDIEVGPDGNVYASSLTLDFENFGPGAVFRIGEDGAAELVVEGLFMPHGIAFDADGNLYVAVYALLSGPDAPAGQVVRIDGIAASA